MYWEEAETSNHVPVLLCMPNKMALCWGTTGDNGFGAVVSVYLKGPLLIQDQEVVCIYSPQTAWVAYSCPAFKSVKISDRIILNTFQPFAESDFKPRLWRKVAQRDKNGVRKVHAMWMVRKPLAAVFTPPPPCWWHAVASFQHYKCRHSLKDERVTALINWNTSLSTQEIPSTCQDTFTYRISQTPYKERGSRTDTLCGNAICDMNQDAHRIKMTVFHNETMFVEDSVYVPANEESEF